MKRGLYRIHGADGLPDDVRVEDDGIEVPLEERLYRARGYLPAVEHLPWRDEYLSAKESADSSAAAKEDADKAARERSRRDFLGQFRKP
jgi:hypothetical protein